MIVCAGMFVGGMATTYVAQWVSENVLLKHFGSMKTIRGRVEKSDSRTEKLRGFWNERLKYASDKNLHKEIQEDAKFYEELRKLHLRQARKLMQEAKKDKFAALALQRIAARFQYTDQELNTTSQIGSNVDILDTDGIVEIGVPALA